MEEMFSTDKIKWQSWEWDWIIYAFFHWITWNKRTQEFLDLIVNWRNVWSIIFSLIFIWFLFIFSFEWIRTANDLIDRWIEKEQAWDTIWKVIDNTTTWSEYKKQLNEDINKMSDKIISLIADVKNWKEIETPAIVYWTSYSNKKEEKEEKEINYDEIFNHKRIAQKFFLWITLHWDKQIGSDITYYLAWLPLEPVSFSKIWNFVYYTILLLVIFSFWMIIFAVVPILDLIKIIFTKIEYNYIDYIWLFIRFIIAILLYLRLFNIYTL